MSRAHANNFLIEISHTAPLPTPEKRKSEIDARSFRREKNKRNRQNREGGQKCKIDTRMPLAKYTRAGSLPFLPTHTSPPVLTGQGSRVLVALSRKSKPVGTRSSMGSPTAKAALFLSASTLILRPTTPFLAPAHPGEIDLKDSHRRTPRLGVCVW